MADGRFLVKTDSGMKTYRTCLEVLEKAEAGSGSDWRYREFKNGKAIEVFEDPLASKPIQSVRLNQVNLRGKWIIDIDEDPDTGEACLIVEDPVTKSSIELWMPSRLDRTSFVGYSVNSVRPVEQRPNKRGIDYETLINERTSPEESVLQRVERRAMNQLARKVTAVMEMLASLERELFCLPRRIGLTRILPWG